MRECVDIICSDDFDTRYYFPTRHLNFRMSQVNYFFMFFMRAINYVRQFIRYTYCCVESSLLEIVDHSIILKNMHENTMPNIIKIATIIPDAPITFARSRINWKPTS